MFHRQHIVSLRTTTRQSRRSHSLGSRSLPARQLLQTSVSSPPAAPFRHASSVVTKADCQGGCDGAQGFRRGRGRRGAAVGVVVMRAQPSVWSRAQEAYLAELYVVPSQRGRGYGRELITEAMRVAREHGADYAFVVTSEDDRLAQRLYEAAGFRRTEGEGGPLMLAYEREL